MRKQSLWAIRQPVPRGTALALAFIMPVLVLGAWCVVSYGHLAPPDFVPSPTEVVRAWRVKIEREQGPLGIHEAAVIALAVSPDGKTVATGSKDGILVLWDTATDSPRPTAWTAVPRDPTR